MTKRTALNGRRVLIVEDQYIIADEMNRAVLALGGVPVGPFASVEQAHCQLEQDEGEIALALLDVNLGGETAYPLADELEARKVAVVFATGSRTGLSPLRIASTGSCRSRSPGPRWRDSSSGLIFAPEARELNRGDTVGDGRRFPWGTGAPAGSHEGRVQPSAGIR